MTTPDSIVVEVINWKKIQTKETLKTPYWFRVNIDITASESLSELSPAQKWVWICLLSLCAKRKSGKIHTTLKYFIDLTKCSKNDVLQAFDILKQNGTLRFDSVETPSKLRENSVYNTIQDKIIENTIDHFSQNDRVTFDFESVYEKYPKKVGKAKGLENLQKRIKNIKDWHDFQKAVDNYCEYVKQQNFDKKYIKQFDSFTNCWRNFLEMDVSDPIDDMELT